MKRVLAVVVLMFSLAAPTLAQTVGEQAKLSHIDLFDGTRFDPKSIEGKPTLVYFWASWCPRCRQEMSGLEKHYQAYKDKGFTILAVNFRDKPNDAKALIEAAKPISFPVGTINDAWYGDYPQLRGTPTWMLIDKKGTIRKVIVGREVITGHPSDELGSELKTITSE